MEKLGLYIHIPFCVKKCAYCDFYSVCDLALREDYVKALIAQIANSRTAGRNHVVDSIYIGGGTPSLLTGEQMLRILTAVRSAFKVSEDAEITMEANPGTLDTEKISAYHEAGINRLSIGLQSADDDELNRLSRIHTRSQFESSFILARLEGFENISVDIMYALPGQSEKLLSETLDYVIAMDPDHISFYGLKVEPNTPFGQNPQIEEEIPDEDRQYDMYLNSAKKLEESGFIQYEISNFAKPGAECRHNIKYWKCDEYLGFGPAAHSFFDGKMFSYVKDVNKFLAFPTDSHALMDECSVPSFDEVATQFVMLGFRMRGGIDIVEYGERFGDDFEARYKERMKPFLLKQYILKTKKGYRLSRRGMLISNYILSEILEF